MTADDLSLSDPASIRERVLAAAAEEAAMRPFDPEPDEGPPDTTEIFDGVTVDDVEKCFRYNQVGDGILAMKLMRGKFCFDNVDQRPYRFNCTHWFRDKNCDWRKALFGVADLYAMREAHHRAIAREADPSDHDGKKAIKRAEAWAKRVNACRDVTRIRKIWEVATSGAGSLGISGDQWNKHPTLLPALNTVVDLETGKAIKPDPTQYFNKAATAPFLGLQTEAKFWVETIHKALGGQDDLIDYFEYMVGFAATGIQTKDFFCAYGPGGDNGKSVIFEWLMKILGEFAGSIKVEMLLEEKFMRSADGPSPAMLKLRGLRMAVTSEAEAKHRFAMGKIKSICSGGDRMEARGINAADIVEFVPELTLILHSNDLPKAAGNDEAFYRRLKLILFGSKFINPALGPEDTGRHIYHARPRTEVDKILTAESPGILAYIVRCAMKAIKLGDMPPPPESVVRETNRYRAGEDLVGSFLRECTVPDTDNKERMKAIYTAFKKWCMEEQMMTEKAVWSIKALGQDLRKRPGLEVIDSNVVYYKGLRIKEEFRQSDKPGADSQVPF